MSGGANYLDLEDERMEREGATLASDRSSSRKGCCGSHVKSPQLCFPLQLDRLSSILRYIIPVNFISHFIVFKDVRRLSNIIFPNSFFALHFVGD